MFIVSVFILMNLKSLGNNFRNQFLSVSKILTPDLETPKYKHKAARDIFDPFPVGHASGDIVGLSVGSAALGLKPSVDQTAPRSPVSILGFGRGGLLGADNSCLGALGGGVLQGAAEQLLHSSVPCRPPGLFLLPVSLLVSQMEDFSTPQHCISQSPPAVTPAWNCKNWYLISLEFLNAKCFK